MKKLLLILILAVYAQAEWRNQSGWNDYRDNGKDLARIATALERIANTLDRMEKNSRPVQPIQKQEPPKPVVVEDLSKQYPSLYNRKLVFPEDEVQEEVQEDSTTVCIRECAEIYETTDKYELKDCLIDMCGFTLQDIFK